MFCHKDKPSTFVSFITRYNLRADMFDSIFFDGIWKLMNTTIIKHLNFHFHMKNLTLALRDLQFKHLFTITLIGKFQQLTTTTTNQLFLLIVNGTATIQLLSVISTLFVTGTLQFLVLIIRALDL